VSLADATDDALSLAMLSGALRAQGLHVTLRDELDAADALPLVDRGDRDEVRAALRIALKVARDGWPAFDRAFAAAWRGDEPAPPSAARAPAAKPVPLLGRARAPALSWDPDARRMGGPDDAGARDAEGLPAWSPAALLRRKPFDAVDWSPQELAEMEALLTRLARRLAARRSRRLVATPGARRGRVDPRRSFRRALGTAGEILRFARRERAADQPRLVFLCDTSGSMDAHARFLLMFVLALRRAVPRAELYAFNTELVRLTREVAPGKIRLSLERIAASVPDWSGGTRLGDCLTAFADGDLARTVDARTTVVVLSDGLDRGEPAVLAAALRRIRSRARKLIWLNPLLGDARYEPTARGMQAALPFVDHLLPAHDLASLERLVPELTR
jgi:uncharacterized protein with von Willebrand factor type A (vWA) domain